MGKFGIGARVRDDGGDAGEIVDKRKGERLVRYDDTDYGSLWQLKGRLSALPLEVVANDNAVSACPPVFEKEYSVMEGVTYTDTEGTAVGPMIAYMDGFIEVLGDGRMWNADGSAANEHPSLVLRPTPATPPTFAKGDRALSMNGDYVTVDTDPDSANHVWVSIGTTKWRTPVDMLAKWEPKVGDRVKLVKDGTSTTGAVGKIATLEAWSDGSYIDDGQYLLNIDAPVDYETRAVDEKYTRATIGCFEPLPVAAEAQPAAALWAPVAGKFGKTRDGRKVGPVVSSSGHQPWKLYDHSGPADRGYEADGSWLDANNPSRHDLVAEWVEPVQEAAVAVAEPPEPAAPPAKFKVGDRVRIVRNNRPNQTHLNEEIGKEFTITRKDGPGDTGWSGDSSENGYWWEESELELAPTLPIGSTVTFTATGRLSAINDNGHLQVTFPDLAPAQNSFALPAKYVTAA